MASATGGSTTAPRKTYSLACILASSQLPLRNVCATRTEMHESSELARFDEGAEVGLPARVGIIPRASANFPQGEQSLTLCQDASQGVRAGAAFFVGRHDLDGIRA